METSKPLLLDTYVWVKAQLFPELVRPSVQERIRQAAEDNLIFVSVISIWEIAMLVRDGKLDLDGGAKGWTEAALSLPGISLLPLSSAIAIASVNLPWPLHNDPSDRIVVASALVEEMILVTSDRAVQEFAKATGLAHLCA